MKSHSLALLSLALVSSRCLAFTAPPSFPSSHSSSSLRLSQQPQETTTTNTDNEDDVMQSLTPELLKMTHAFRDIGDDKLRYKQLLYMANQLPPLASPETTMIPSNKVPGCLSTVYIDGTTSYNEKKEEYIVDFVGESDGLLTKGLVALLVRGLSGCTCDEISKVNPEFIKEAKISQSLTPGRNNGFLNMLSSMKIKARQLVEKAKQNGNGNGNDEGSNSDEEDDNTASSDDTDNKPIYNSMMKSLQQLQPIQVELVDTSHQHAGHAGASGYNGESHFELTIVADAFDGLNLVKRHQLVYMILGKEMPQIHALNIQARTPSEVNNES